MNEPERYYYPDLHLPSAMPDGSKSDRSTRSIFSIITVENLYRFFGLLLIIIGVTFYLGWSIAYDTWTDVGLYSFVVPLIIFGLLLLALINEKKVEQKNSQ